MTNYIAIQMLFLPYRPGHSHWLRVITLGLWKQGVVPARKPEIARSVGRVAADNVLTPERVARELTQVVSSLLEDLQLREQIRNFFGPVLRENLPAIVDRLLPEIMGLFDKAIRESLDREKLTTFLEYVLRPWSEDEGNRPRFVDTLLGLIRENIDPFVSQLRRAVERYSNRGLVKKIAVELGECLGAIDWAAIRADLIQQLESFEGRQALYRFAGELPGTFLQQLRSENYADVLSALGQNIRKFVTEATESFLQRNLPELGSRLIETPEFWRWLAEEAIPTARPHIVQWLEAEGSHLFAARFDVAGRVQEAILELRVEDVHRMVDDVSGSELGAIQVLGFVLGAATGLVMILCLH
jgi:uncharacterized membrane protein YheB (UPF0754 family)